MNRKGGDRSKWEDSDGAQNEVKSVERKGFDNSFVHKSIRLRASPIDECVIGTRQLRKIQGKLLRNAVN